jgi:uncharacterized membrane protein
MLGGIITAGLAFYAARGREHPAEIAAILSLSRRGVLLSALGLAMTVAFGLWLVRVANFGYTDSWLVAAYVLFFAALALGGATGAVPKRARLLAERLAAEGSGSTEELQALLYHRPSELLNHLSSLLMIAVLVLMVWRPGA